MTIQIFDIPQANPKAAYLEHKTTIDKAIQMVLRSGSYILGSEVDNFEKEFAGFNQAKFGVGMASGTDAIEIALRCLDIGIGHLVFTVSHTAVATVSAIERTGAKAVFVDIDEQTYTMDPLKLQKTIERSLEGNNSEGRGPAAIIPVHIYGHPANMPEIMNIAEKYALHVVEDCAQAHGAAISGQRVGTFGHLSAFSFYPTKNLGAIGDGGMVLTNNEEYYEKLLALRQYGWQERYISSMPGINSRLDEIQAAILRVKLPYLEKDNRRRCHIAEQYTAALRETALVPAAVDDRVQPVYHQYVLKTAQRDKFMRYMRNEGVQSAIHYPLPVHMQPAYQGRIKKHDELAVTEKTCRRIVSLPMYPQLTDVQVEYIADILSKWHGD